MRVVGSFIEQCNMFRQMAIRIETGLESLAREGNSPVRVKISVKQRDTRVQRDTRNPVGICEDHLARLNTPQRPIVNKYREGKVKSTPARGVKENLKPSAYKPLQL